MYKGHKVVVTMTMATKRIGQCAKVIETVVNNTRQPDAVYLNLSVVEFPNRESNLPKDLV